MTFRLVFGGNVPGKSAGNDHHGGIDLLGSLLSWIKKLIDYKDDHFDPCGCGDKDPHPSGFPGAVVLTAGDDLLPAGGLPGNDTVFALAGNDTLYLGTGNDLAYAGNGNDRVFTGTGSDIVHGGRGDDWLDGQAGDDCLYGGKGNDTISANEGSDQLFGGDGKDTLVGGPGNDRIYGDAGRDSATGGLGDDWVFGGKDSDNLAGGAGNDFLSGGAGKDTLMGEAGCDTFEFAKGGGKDKVVDYVIGEDRIDLASISQHSLRFSQTSEGLLITAPSCDSLLLVDLTLADKGDLAFV
jgi:Ca2+-binding RTX toxin-like protein